MEKRDYIWVAIRIFGIYLLVQALFSLLTLAYASLQVYQCGMDVSTEELMAALKRTNPWDCDDSTCAFTNGSPSLWRGGCIHDVPWRIALPLDMPA